MKAAGPVGATQRGVGTSRPSSGTEGKAGYNSQSDTIHFGNDGALLAPVSCFVLYLAQNLAAIVGSIPVRVNVEHLATRGEDISDMGC